MRINRTIPGRLHLIRDEGLLYVTVVLFGRRFHLQVSRTGIPDGGLWQ